MKTENLERYKTYILNMTNGTKELVPRPVYYIGEFNNIYYFIYQYDNSLANLNLLKKYGFDVDEIIKELNLDKYNMTYELEKDAPGYDLIDKIIKQHDLFGLTKGHIENFMEEK